MVDRLHIIDDRRENRRGAVPYKLAAMETGALTSRLRREARAIADARECPVGRKRRGRAAKMKLLDWPPKPTRFP